MASPDDDRWFSTEEIKAATAGGQLPALAERLARGRAFAKLGALFERTNALPIPRAQLTEAVRRATRALRPGPGGRRERLGDEEEKRNARILAAESLLDRVARPPLTADDRDALDAAAAALADAGDLHRAATTFELATSWPAAAEAWGRLGELDAMEACLSHDESRRDSRRAASGAVRDIEARLAAGERVAALRIAESLREGVAEAAAVRLLALGVGARLVRARGVTLRRPDGRVVRFAATPAILGRDPQAEIALRDPGVSRRHALIAVVGDETSLTDAGSRLGTFVGGARLAEPFAVHGTTEVQLGSSCRLQISESTAAGRVTVRGLSGLDRELLISVGAGPLPLTDLIPEAGGAWIEFDRASASLCHPPELPVRLAGQLAAPRIDLLHGDRLEIGPDALMVEVL
jgi:hypothetical protein